MSVTSNSIPRQIAEMSHEELKNATIKMLSVARELCLKHGIPVEEMFAPFIPFPEKFKENST